MHLGLLKDYLTFLAGDLRHCWSVSRSVRPLYFRLMISRSHVSSNEVQEFISTSLAENNKALLDQISKLAADSA